MTHDQRYSDLSTYYFAGVRFRQLKNCTLLFYTWLQDNDNSPSGSLGSGVLDFKIGIINLLHSEEIIPQNNKCYTK
jgi:hypothetical protein